MNVIAYYSSQIFLDAGMSAQSALTASLIFGIITFIFAIPAIYTIDTFGRRNLLLTTLPILAVCLLLIGLAFKIPSTSPFHIGCIALGIYLFGMAYGPGPGPVPFTYSAEAYPLRIRAEGMSLATATGWLFNFALGVTWPSMLAALRPMGAFAFYAAWNVVGFFAVLFLVPETKGKTLEELDRVFADVSTAERISGGMATLTWAWRRYGLRDKSAPPPPDLDAHEDVELRRYRRRNRGRTSSEEEDQGVIDDVHGGEDSQLLAEGQL